jgi:hypothetical protein
MKDFLEFRNVYGMEFAKTLHALFSFYAAWILRVTLRIGTRNSILSRVDRQLFKPVQILIDNRASR